MNIFFLHLHGWALAISMYDILLKEFYDIIIQKYFFFRHL